jgi:hypothetical protein
LPHQTFVLPDGGREDLQVAKFVEIAEHWILAVRAGIPDSDDLKTGPVLIRIVGDDNAAQIRPLIASVGENLLHFPPGELAKIGTVLHLNREQAM